MQNVYNWYSKCWLFEITFVFDQQVDSEKLEFRIVTIILIMMFPSCRLFDSADGFTKTNFLFFDDSAHIFQSCLTNNCQLLVALPSAGSAAGIVQCFPDFVTNHPTNRAIDRCGWFSFVFDSILLRIFICLLKFKSHVLSFKLKSTFSSFNLNLINYFSITLMNCVLRSFIK